MSTLLAHIATFLFSAGIIWLFSGLLIESVGRVAHRFHKTGFTVAFFVLGIVTSISEISVAVNATLGGVPQVSAGNLIGASFVLLLLVVPLLAIIGRSIQLNHVISRPNLLISFAVILLPPLLIIDGNVTATEGFLMILSYLTLVWEIQRQHRSPIELKKIPQELLPRASSSVGDFLRILIAGIGIFAAGHYLVEQAVYFAEVLRVPNSLIGLILLSIGTNVPELTVAIRSVLKRRNDIAFGDYLGSAAANTLIFGVLVIGNHGFSIEPSEFFPTTILMAGGLGLCYLFAATGRAISRSEGVSLIFLYFCFLTIQILNIIRFAAD